MCLEIRLHSIDSKHFGKMVLLDKKENTYPSYKVAKRYLVVECIFRIRNYEHPTQVEQAER